MPGQQQIHNFSGGEIAPDLIARSDLEVYSSAVAEATNWFVTATGALSTRPGTKLINRIRGDTGRIKMFPFSFGTTRHNTYIILFSRFRINFIQTGRLLFEQEHYVPSFIRGEQTTISTKAPLRDGDIVRVFGIREIYNRLLAVRHVSGETFRLTVLGHGEPTTLVGPLGGSVTFFTESGRDLNSLGFSRYNNRQNVRVRITIQRLYTVATPYDEFDIPHLQAKQTYDLVRITHPHYPICNLIRDNHTSWRFEKEVIGHSFILGDNLNIQVTSSEHQPTKDELEAKTDTPAGQPTEQTGPKSKNPADDDDGDVDVGDDGQDTDFSDFDDDIDFGEGIDDPGNLDVGPPGDEPADPGEGNEGQGGAATGEEGGGEVGDGPDQGDE